MIFSCSHTGNYSFPMRLEDEKREHVTCADCKQRIPYSWDEMKIVKPKKPAQKLREVLRSTAE